MHKKETKKSTICWTEVYKKMGNDWYNRNLWIEHQLVLNYEILPEQIIFAVRIHKWWFTLFRDKWTKRIKTLFLNESI